MKPIHIKKLSRPIAKVHHSAFSGRIYSLGAGYVSVRDTAAEPSHSVLCVHGFLMNKLYFEQLYPEADIELISLTCSNYHLPVTNPEYSEAPWYTPIEYHESTLDYDAAMLNQALEHLPRGQHIRVHGHSRGGGVVVEAIRQRPELYTNVEVVLEAPVMPQGEIHPMVVTLLSRITPGMWPYLIRFVQNTPLVAYGPSLFGPLNEAKLALLDNIFANVQNYLTIVFNIESIRHWMQSTPAQDLSHITQGTILIPERDRILTREPMLASAQQSPNHINIIETKDTSHFIALDSIEWLPKLPPIN